MTDSMDDESSARLAGLSMQLTPSFDAISRIELSSELTKIFSKVMR